MERESGGVTLWEAIPDRWQKAMYQKKKAMYQEERGGGSGQMEHPEVGDQEEKGGRGRFMETHKGTPL